MEVLEDNETNVLVRTDNGKITTKSKSSPLNKLLFEHGLFDFFQTGSEIWTAGGDEQPTVRIIPDGDAECYTIEIDTPDYPPLLLGAHQKTNLVSLFEEMYENDKNRAKSVIDFYEKVRGDMARSEILDTFSKPFRSRVELREGGWFINGHLLLSYEGEFYHSEHVSRSRSGSIIGRGMSTKSYEQAVPEPDGSISRNITVDGEKRRLTNAEVEFLTKALWAIENTPDRREKNEM